MPRPHGYRMSEESKKKTSMALKGRKRRPETCRKISETRQKHSLYNDLARQYKDDPEALRWINENKEELLLKFEDGIKSESEIQHGGKRHYELSDVHAKDVKNPETYLILKEDLSEVYQERNQGNSQRGDTESADNCHQYWHRGRATNLKA
jgi:hypothetical protein